MKDISRRDFLKVSGTTAATAALASCSMKDAGDDGEVDYMGHHDGPVPTDKMTYRTNPKQGDKISLLGYGWMRLPTVNNGSARTPENTRGNEIDQEQVNRLCKYALDHGVNYFDTSPAYCRGKSEESLGIALEASGYKRSDYFIATKLSNFSPSQYDFEEGKAMFERSLEYLKTDYIDYLLLHSIGGGGMGPVHQRYLDNGLLDWLMEQREAGRIRNLGFSFHGDVAVFDWALAHHDEYHWDFVQIQANYVDWENEEDKGRSGKYLYDELVKRSIPVVIMEPLLGGRLSKVPDQEEEQEWLEEETATLIKSYPTIDCNDCKYCMPCPYGLDIPGIFVHYNKCVNKGNVPESQQAKNYEKARRAFLVGYDRSVPKLRQANHCIECRECISHCPQQIDIPREMQRIDSFVEKLKQGTL